MVLLDTCAAIWMFEQEPLARRPCAPFRHAAVLGALLVSPVSAWEVGLLARRRQPLSFQTIGASWIDDCLRGRQSGRCRLRIALRSQRPLFLAICTADPADRLLIATARELKVPLVTRDRRILDYAAQGHVDAIAC